MGFVINVASIPFYITGEDFLKALTTVEKKLLRPFIVKGRAPAHSIVTNIKIIGRIPCNKNNKIGYSLINKIRPFFPSDIDKRLVKSQQQFIESLGFYLSDKEIKKIGDYLRGRNNHNKIVIGWSSLLFFNKETRRCNIFLKKASYEERRWAYNLNILRLLLRMIFNSEGKGMLLHASSVEEKGYGYIFIGRGSSGKSTAARLLKPQRILSDDTTVIRKKNNVYELFANPWWNPDKDIKIKYPQQPVPLKAAFFIKKAKKTSLKMVSYKKALCALIYGDSICQQAGFFDNKIGIRNFYLFSLKLVKDIPVFELCVKKDHSFKDKFQKLVNRYFQNG